MMLTVTYWISFVARTGSNCVCEAQSSCCQTMFRDANETNPGPCNMHIYSTWGLPKNYCAESDKFGGGSHARDDEHI
ncbi:hypothetical protein P692DRAFT_20136190 [Suillus brevipes Sb2]|nr:hypothetical protein P692DRAFT_20136190 [Suillus brevipes Sb2]